MYTLPYKIVAHFSKNYFAFNSTLKYSNRTVSPPKTQTQSPHDVVDIAEKRNDGGDPQTSEPTEMESISSSSSSANNNNGDSDTIASSDTVVATAAGNRSTDESNGSDGAAATAATDATLMTASNSGDAVHEHRTREHSESGETNSQHNDEAHEADGHEHSAHGDSGAHRRRTKHDKRRKYEKGE